MEQVGAADQWVGEPAHLLVTLAGSTKGRDSQGAVEPVDSSVTATEHAWKLILT